MQNTYDYDRLEYNLSHHLQFKTKSSLSEAAKLMKHELLKSEKTALCVISKLKFHHIHATYFYYTTLPKECVAHMEKEVEILEAHPSIMQLRLQDYIFSITIFFCFCASKTILKNSTSGFFNFEIKALVIKFLRAYGSRHWRKVIW